MSGYDPPDVHSRPLFDDGIRHLARKVEAGIVTWCGELVDEDHKGPSDKELKLRGVYTPANCHCCHRSYRLAHNIPLETDLEEMITR
jgi:hypothetical protein